MGTSVKTLKVKLTVYTKKDIPDLLDKIAGRAYTIDGVVDVVAKFKKPHEQQAKQKRASASSKG